MTTTFVLVDSSQGATVSSGEALTAPKLAAIATALQVQLNRDVGAFHGGGPYLVRVGTGLDTQPGEYLGPILPALPSDPNAIAYHADNEAGVPDFFDAISLSDTLHGPGNSLMAALGHEMIEIIGDEGCNLWADGGDSSEYAHELCDPVEVQSYEVVPGFWGSNFVLRSYFDPNHAGPYDFMSATGQPGAVAPPGPMRVASGAGGNYQIVRTAGTKVNQVTGMGAPSITVSATFPFGMRRPWRHGSRRHRRGVER